MTKSITIKNKIYYKRSYANIWYYIDSWGIEHDTAPYMSDAIDVLLDLSYGEKL